MFGEGEGEGGDSKEGVWRRGLVVHSVFLNHLDEEETIHPHPQTISSASQQ